MTTEPAVRVIAIDWGSSRLRISALDRDGGTVRVASSSDGILVTPRAEQRARLIDALAPFRAAWPDAPVIAGGMIGSRNGLAESVPVTLPAGTPEIAAGIRPLVIDDGTTALMTPGLADDTGHVRDLIRGEEVQIVGWLAQHPTVLDTTLILPGTHSKWVRVTGGRIETFRTFLTGELYAQVIGSPSFAGMDAATGDVSADPAFRDGVRQAGAAEGLLHDLFAARARALSAPEGFAIGSYLSGLLVGYEIAEARSRGLLPVDGSVVLLSAGALNEVYRVALGLCGIEPLTAPADTFAAGALALFVRYADQELEESR
jgi:2-dehydro-3-deoxygalactonokinase